MSYAYFTDPAQIKAAGVPIAADVKLPQLEPYLVRAEQNVLLPALGRATLDQVQSTEPAELLVLIRHVLASYAVQAFAAVNQRITSSTGTDAQPGTKENANTLKLIERHLAALDASATAATDAVLAYLEDHPADFPTWHASPYCTVYPRRYLQHIEQLREYPGAPQNRQAFRQAQGALLVHTSRHVLAIVGRPLHQRLLDELAEPEHQEVLQYIRTALAYYLAGDAHTAECSLTELRWLLQRSPDEYPEFEESPAYVPTEIGPMTTENAFVGI